MSPFSILPTPEGVPVYIRSPATSGTVCDSRYIISLTDQIILLLSDFCLHSPFTLKLIFNLSDSIDKFHLNNISNSQIHINFTRLRKMKSSRDMGMQKNDGQMSQPGTSLIQYHHQKSD